MCIYTCGVFIDSAGHAVIKTRMTHAANKRSSGIYTLEDRQEKGAAKKKEKK